MAFGLEVDTKTLTPCIPLCLPMGEGEGNNSGGSPQTPARSRRIGTLASSSGRVLKPLLDAQLQSGFQQRLRQVGIAHELHQVLVNVSSDLGVIGDYVLILRGV